MSVDEVSVTTAAMGPVQARALRRSNMTDDDDGLDLEELVEETSHDEVPRPAPATNSDTARDAASAADHAARLSRFTALPDDLLDQLRTAAADASEIEPEPPKARRRWRR